MIYDLSDKWLNSKKYFGETDISKIKSYYIYGKVNRSVMGRDINDIYIIGINKNGVFLDCKKLNLNNLKNGKTYCFEIESNKYTFPVVKRILYDVSNKKWLV